MQAHEPDHTTDLCTALTKLFTAFPLYKHTDEARKQRMEQYQLHYDRLSELPADLVESQYSLGRASFAGDAVELLEGTDSPTWAKRGVCAV